MLSVDREQFKEYGNKLDGFDFFSFIELNGCSLTTMMPEFGINYISSIRKLESSDLYY